MSSVRNKTTDQLFEDGYAEIMLGAFRLRKEGKYQEAYDQLGHVMSLIMEDRTELRTRHGVDFR